jgi:His-Xaa-Ser system protein HxsD
MVEHVLVEFDAKAQTLSALQAAAYRLIGIASCEIGKVDERWVCRVIPSGIKPEASTDELRTRLVELVTDENLRQSIAAKTEPTRNLILALAFGHLAAQATPDSQ